MKNPTIAEVARRAGVSKSTVSAVLNNKDIVKESTRQAILQVIDELDYRPQASARRRMPAATGSGICFVIKEPGNPYYAEVLDGIQDVAHEQGCLVFACSSEGVSDLEHQIARQCTARAIDGLVVTPILNDDSDLSHLFELKRNNVPFVLLERVRGLQTNLVDIDNVRASAEAVRYLIENGHSRVAHFAGPRYSAHSEERVEGFRRAFSESHLIFHQGMIVRAGDSLEDGYRAGLEFFGSLAPDSRPTAAISRRPVSKMNFRFGNVRSRSAIFTDTAPCEFRAASWIPSSVG